VSGLTSKFSAAASVAAVCAFGLTLQPLAARGKGVGQQREIARLGSAPLTPLTQVRNDLLVLDRRHPTASRQPFGGDVLVAKGSSGAGAGPDGKLSRTLGEFSANSLAAGIGGKAAPPGAAVWRRAQITFRARRQVRRTGAAPYTRADRQRRWSLASIWTGSCLTIERTAVTAQGRHTYHDQASDDSEAKLADVIAREERRYLGDHLRRQVLLVAASRIESDIWFALRFVTQRPRTSHKSFLAFAGREGLVSRPAERSRSPQVAP
jgi:hypothetical protein